MEAVFTFFFKYRPLLYAQGQVVVQPPVPVAVLLLLLLVAAGGVVWWYRRPQAKARRADRIGLAALRVLVLALLLLCLLQPTLVLSRVVPQQNYVGVLIDDSRSMRIADAAGAARTEFVMSSLGEADAALLRALEERFQVRLFRFAEQVERVASAAELTFDGSRTSIAPALDRVRQELSALPLSGIVLVTDGADSGGGADGVGSALAESLLALRAAGIPVFPVGVGAEAYDRDVELSHVTAPRQALRGTSLLVDLMVAQTGYAGRRVTVLVEDEGRIVGSEEVELPRSGEPAPVRVLFTAADAGPRRFRFRIPAQDGERVHENNEQEALIHVKEDRAKILYFEGEPRYEAGFIRRAVAADSTLQVVVLQRTAAGKYMRLDIDSAGHLLTGFPATREELFGYRGLILGSVEASHFSHEQLRMIAEFVSERGGGLLMLGGRHSFAEGGYAGTPVADVLPVALDPRHARDTLFFDTLRVALTRAGLSQPALRIAGDDRRSEQRWRELPAPTTYNRVGALKPGALTLVSGAGRTGGAAPVLAWQRYGRGHAFALPVQDTWIWQMHADVAVDDETHQRFWRQLLRWLVNGSPEPIVATLAADRAAPGQAVRIMGDVSDAVFMKLNNARVTALITAPDGAESRVPLDWLPGRDGEYRGTFTPAMAGLHTVLLTAAHDGREYTARPAYLYAGDSRDEFYASQMRAPLLKRVAAETGGRFYTAATVGSLADDISYMGAGAAEREELDLWDAPIVFLLLVLLLGGEWAWRRSRGLV